MIVHFLPDTARALVFDMDGTLYTHAEYEKYQETSQVKRLAREKAVSVGQALELLEKARKIRMDSGLPKTSMAQHFLSLGIDMPTIIRWREEEIHPREWLQKDAKLEESLGMLAKRYRLALLTNNPKKIGVEGLEALGVLHRFETVVGLDDTHTSKPAREPFLKVCSVLGLSPGDCVSIGDRRDIDIEPALAVGMGGIFVDGVEDVYALPDALLKPIA